jgi:hypothetical protein
MASRPAAASTSSDSRISARTIQRLVVGHQHERALVLAVEREQELDDLRPGGGVEVAGGLVGQDEPRPQRQGPGDRHALLLAAGELGGVVVGAVGEPHGRKELAGPVERAGPAGQLQRHRHVLERGERGDQVVGLEHEADAVPAQARQRVLVEAGDLHAVQHDGAGGGPVEPGDEPEQRGLAAAGGPGDRHHLARVHVEAYAVEDRHCPPATAKPHHEVAHLEHHATHTTLGP